MLDERAAKRSDKSPDYTCANLTCASSKNGKSYRTAIWAEKSSGAEAPSQTAAGVSPPANVGAPPAEPKPTMRVAYKQLTEWVISDILPIYDAEFGNGVCGPDVTAAITATLFIQACKSGKVE